MLVKLTPGLQMRIITNFYRQCQLFILFLMPTKSDYFYRGLKPPHNLNVTTHALEKLVFFANDTYVCKMLPGTQSKRSITQQGFLETINFEPFITMGWLLQCVSPIQASKIGLWWFNFKLEPIFATTPVASKNEAHLKSGQN